MTQTFNQKIADDLRKTVEVEEAKLAKLRRQLDRYESIPSYLTEEPEPGTVLRFSRKIGSDGKGMTYTFIAMRVSDKPDAWHLTGKAGVLKSMGLVETGNTWDAVSLAIGQSKVRKATQWVNLKEESIAYNYTISLMTDHVYRTNPETDLVEVRTALGTWRQSGMLARQVRGVFFRECDENGRYARG